MFSRTLGPRKLKSCVEYERNKTWSRVVFGFNKKQMAFKCERLLIYESVCSMFLLSRSMPRVSLIPSVSIIQSNVITHIKYIWLTVLCQDEYVWKNEKN